MRLRHAEGYGSAGPSLHSTVSTVALGVAAILGIGFALSLLGSVFRANVEVWIVFWAAIPCVACLFFHTNVQESLAERQMITGRTLLLTIAIVLSVCILAHGDVIRNRFGRQYVQGYRHKVSDEPEAGDGGFEHYPDEWHAETKAGWCAVQAVVWVTMIGVFAVPYATWKISCKAIDKKSSSSQDSTAERAV